MQGEATAVTFSYASYTRLYITGYSNWLLLLVVQVTITLAQVNFSCAGCYVIVTLVLGAQV